MSDKIVSPSGRYELDMQDDGNLVIYRKDGSAYWALGADPYPLPTPPTPSPTADPRHGFSYYTSATDPRVDIPEFALRLRDLGAGSTRVWLIDAWALGASHGTGCYDGLVPWATRPDGRFDLWALNPRYFDWLHGYVEAMNDAGVRPRLTTWELYSWSDRKQGMLWVPDAARGPFRRNQQGISYSDDSAFQRIAQPSGEDAFLGHFIQRVVQVLNGTKYDVETGNEMPEKALHYRLRDRWREAGYTGHVSVNRQDDTPGQYSNMKVGQDFDQIAYHGKRTLGYLDEVYPNEPVYPTFRAFYASGPDAQRIVLSSDGCRISTNVEAAYDYDALGDVFEDALRRGCSIEHQSCMKLRGFTEGRIDLTDIRHDAPMWARLTR